MKRPFQRIIACLIALPAACVVAIVTYQLVTDFVAAERAAAPNAQRLEQLIQAARHDMSKGPELEAEYIRQKQASLKRRAWQQEETYLLIAAVVAFVVGAKWFRATVGEAAPQLTQIQKHRGDLATGAVVRRRWWRRSARPKQDQDGRTEAPSIDLSFVDRVVAEEGRATEAAIPILQRIQTHYRYLPDEALRRVCELTDISPAQIAGVSTFYAQFRRSPVGRHIVKVCHGTACHVAGAREVTDEIRRRLKIPDEADTDPDRLFTVDEVACLGCCSLAPVIMIDETTAGNLTPATACDAIGAFRMEQDG